MRLWGTYHHKWAACLRFSVCVNQVCLIHNNPAQAVLSAFWNAVGGWESLDCPTRDHPGCQRWCQGQARAPGPSPPSPAQLSKDRELQGEGGHWGCGFAIHWVGKLSHVSRSVWGAWDDFTLQVLGLALFGIGYLYFVLNHIWRNEHFFHLFTKVYKFKLSFTSGLLGPFVWSSQNAKVWKLNVLWVGNDHMERPILRCLPALGLLSCF